MCVFWPGILYIVVFLFYLSVYPGSVRDTHSASGTGQRMKKGGLKKNEGKGQGWLKLVTKVGSFSFCSTSAAYARASSTVENEPTFTR